MTEIYSIKTDDDMCLDLPLKENDQLNQYSKKAIRKKEHCSRDDKLLYSSINKKRKRDKINIKSDDFNSSPHPMRKRQAINKSIEDMLERITITDRDVLPKTRTVKIFSDAMASSSSILLKNLYKNYYPCIIPECYPSQMKEHIISERINSTVHNLSSHRRDIINKKRLSLCNTDQSIFKNQLLTNDKYSTNFYKIQEFELNLQNDDNQWVDYYKDEGDYDDDDSNASNHPNNSYPDSEKSFEYEYDYDNDEDHNSDYIYGKRKDNDYEYVYQDKDEDGDGDDDDDDSDNSRNETL